MNRPAIGFLNELKALLKKHDARIQMHSYYRGAGIETRVVSITGVDEVELFDEGSFVELCEETIQEAIDHEFT